LLSLVSKIVCAKIDARAELTPDKIIQGARMSALFPKEKDILF